MDKGWQRAEEFADRLRWARIRMGYERAKDVAESLAIQAGTYRTYERRKADGGRLPSLTDIRRMARKLHVNWPWLASGEGHPGPDQTSEADRVARFVDMIRQVPADRQEDAIEAATAVINSFVRRAS
jgi:transcriptional regulator with XRE-family HTH domain